MLEGSDQMQAEGRLIANFAWQHMKAATKSRNQLIAIELANAEQPLGAFFEDIRSYGSQCIMSVVAALETLVNEFFLDPNCQLRPVVPNFERW
jgi:hypothetical protein